MSAVLVYCKWTLNQDDDDDDDDGTAPPYLTETLQRTSDMSARLPQHRLWSSRRSTLGDRAFPVAAARVWNSLPFSLRAVQSLTTFRHRLKAELFDSSFT